ncbi:lytic polysaccharide monooxygenase [Rothia nasimurium]|uniref:Chitin-binding protein n=1 Tax=Luteibacter anthropi TaxID=564369 RepID=A0A7X5ZGN0_9GAMM|nr:chitin-binding protein [Luteibacter anthropi]
MNTSVPLPSRARVPLKVGLASVIVGLCAQWAPSAVDAHGMASRPIARQYQCKKDEGYWGAVDGSKIPNAGCRAAYLAVAATEGQQAGIYPFQQYNEVAANPPRYEDMASIMVTVPNGLLCAGGDPRKRGLDVPQSKGWAKSVLRPAGGFVDMAWEATAAHNPSFLMVFLTKPGWSPGSELHWEDLDLIYKGESPEPDRSVYPNVYRYRVPFPAGRHGDAMVYSVWQRRDPGNEGFFNCSDVTIQDAGIPDFPWVEEKPFVAESMKPVPGEQVQFRVLGGDASGREVVDVKLAITDGNRHPVQWVAELASVLNLSHAAHVQVGVRDGDAVRFDGASIYANKVWLRDEGSSSAMRIIPADGPGPGPGDHPAWPEGLGAYKAGDVVKGIDGNLWRCKGHPHGAWCNIKPNTAPESWPYAPGSAAMPADEDQRAWVRAG